MIPETLTEPRMTPGAWAFLAAGWLAVTVLAVWCFRRVLGSDDGE